MSSYEYYYESNGTSALQPYERPYLRLVTDDDVCLPQRSVASAEDAEGPRVEPYDARKALRAILTVLCVFAFLFAVMALADQTIVNRRSAAIDETAFKKISVRSGDSLWSIAASHGIEGADTAEVVRIIEEKNDLRDATLMPGQDLEVPAAHHQ